MSATPLQTLAEEYFKSLNPIAQRISVTVSSTKSAYEDLWNTLSDTEQRQVIDETIILPEAILKYAFEDSLERPEFSPRLHIESNGKYLIDEEVAKGSGLSWRDEHSAPFSWLTKSQLHLNLLNDKSSINSTASPPVIKTRLPPFRSPGGTKTTEISSTVTNSDNSNIVSFIDPPKVVLGGSAGNTAKLASVIGAKLKFPAMKNASNGTSNHATTTTVPTTDNEESQRQSLLSKIKNKTSILKIPTSLRNVTSPKLGSDNVNRNKSNGTDQERLVQGKNAVNVIPAKHNKPMAPKPPVSKPKTPPPPPPPVKRKSSNEGIGAMDPERMALLGDSWSSELSGAQSSSRSATMKSAAESLAMATDSTPDLETASSSVRSPSSVTSPPRETAPDFMEPISGTDTIPKTGFEFLDNW